jgi:hypothetical protein
VHFSTEDIDTLYNNDPCSCVIMEHLEGNKFTVKKSVTLQHGNVQQNNHLPDAWKEIFTAVGIYCCNYVIGPSAHETFLRVDVKPTVVSSAEYEDMHAKRLVNTTEIKSGHSVLSVDLNYVKCGGELRFRVDSANDDTCIVHVDTINLQTSFFAFPTEETLSAWCDRFGIDGFAMYRCNDWEDRGRSARHKYVPNSASFT